MTGSLAALISLQFEPKMGGVSLQNRLRQFLKRLSVETRD